MVPVLINFVLGRGNLWLDHGMINIEGANLRLLHTWMEKGKEKGVEVVIKGPYL